MFLIYKNRVLNLDRIFSIEKKNGINPYMELEFHDHVEYLIFNSEKDRDWAFDEMCGDLDARIMVCNLDYKMQREGIS